MRFLSILLVLSLLLAQTAGAPPLLFASAWSPKSLNPVLWLDATQITGLNDGDSVGTWSDMSGHGNDATQSTASKKPTYKTGIQNGRPIVRFDGVDDVLISASVEIQVGHLFAVVSGGLSNLEGFARGNRGASIERMGLLYPDASTWFSGDINDAIIITRVNGVPSTSHTSAFSAVSGSRAAPTSILGVNVGSSHTPFWNGDIAELLLFPNQLSTAQRDQIETYLRTKWGTP